MTDTYTDDGDGLDMPGGEALDLAIKLIRERAAPGQLLAKMLADHPTAADPADHRELLRYRRYLKAISSLQKIKRKYEEKLC